MRLSAKEKALELVLRYLKIYNNTEEWFNLYIAKQCALIAVDELIKVTDSYREEQYFLQVIEEIEKLKNETK
jgi:hypothetical protein